MGFSVSGSAAIIFLAAFVSFGMLFTAGYGGFEQIEDARAGHAEKVLERQNTDIDIVNVTSADSESVNLTVENTGTETLVVNDTDVLLDGTYQVPDSTNVSDHQNPDIWAPGEELTMNITYSHSGSVRVTIVTGAGVADFREVTL